MELRSALLLLSLAASPATANQAVEEVHPNLSILGATVEHDDADVRASAQAVMFSVAAPVVNHLGFDFSGTFSSARYDTPMDNCSLSTSSLKGEIFARDSQLGRAGVSYRQTGEGRCGSVRSFDFDESGVSASAYADALTFTGARQQRQSGAGSSRDWWSLSLAWYASPNAQVSLTTFGMDRDGENVLTFTMQPSAFDRKVEFALAYTDTENSTGWAVGLNYNFLGGIDMIDRDRRYR